MSARGPIRRASARRPRAVRTGLDQLLARTSLLLDILCGTDVVRRALDDGLSPRRFAREWRRELQAFRRRRLPYLLY